MRSPATQAGDGRSFAGAHSLAPVDKTELSECYVSGRVPRDTRMGCDQVNPEIAPGGGQRPSRL